jgi:hypothetical protein
VAGLLLGLLALFAVCLVGLLSWLAGLPACVVFWACWLAGVAGWQGLLAG